MGLLLSELEEGTIYLCQLSGRKMLITSHTTETHKKQGQDDEIIHKVTAHYYNEAMGTYELKNDLFDYQLEAIT